MAVLSAAGSPPAADNLPAAGKFPRVGKRWGWFLQGLEKFGSGFSEGWKKWREIFQGLEKTAQLFPRGDGHDKILADAA